MKRKISELMEHIRVADVEMDTNTPLSSMRIKELTMRKVKVNKPRRTAFRVLLAAAIITVLAVSVFAAETVFNVGDVIRELFRLDIKNDQVAVLNELGGSFEPQSVTSEGTTVTLAAAYADANVITLYFHVEAPEGIVLPDGMLYEFYDYNNRETEIIEIPDGASYDEIHGVTINIEALPDKDPADNCKDFCVTMSAQTGQKAKFNDGVSKLYHMTGIYEQIVDMNQDDDGYVRLTPGSFTFDIGLANELEEVEVDVYGLTYSGTRSRTWTCHWDVCGQSCEGLETNGREHTEYWDVSITATSLRVSSLSVEWACEYVMSDSSKSANLDFQIVMKDGSIPEMYAAAGGGYGDKESFGVNHFMMPIDLDEIDYILIGDPELGETYKVYIS